MVHKDIIKNAPQNWSVCSSLVWQSGAKGMIRAPLQRVDVIVPQRDTNHNSPSSTATSSQPNVPPLTWQTQGVVKKTSFHELSHCQFPDKGIPVSPAERLQTWPSLFCNKSMWVNAVGCEILAEDNKPKMCFGLQNTVTQTIPCIHFFFYPAQGCLENTDICLLVCRGRVKSAMCSLCMIFI